MISALLGGRKGSIAMIRSKLDGKILEVREGDQFEIGSIKAKVVSLNLDEKFLELETDGKRWIADMSSSLADAFKKSQED